MSPPSQPAMRCAARQLRASDTPGGADSSGLERNDLALLCGKRLNHAVLLALCKLEVAGSIPARSTRKGAGDRLFLSAQLASVPLS